MTTRINIQRLLRSVLTSLVLPLTLAVLIDMQFGWFPFVTIGATVLIIPLSTFLVTRIALSEIEQVILNVAPPETELGAVPE